MTNRNVINSWIDGRGASSCNGNMSTNGVDLYSYNLKIASSQDHQFRIWDYTASGHYYSQTTSCHVGLALRMLDGSFFLMQPSYDGSVDDYYQNLNQGI
jgi:hypothetical protein